MPAGLVSGSVEFGNEQRPNLRDRFCRVGPIQIPDSIRDVTCYVCQKDSPGASFSPSFRTEGTYKTTVCDPCSEDLSGLQISFDFGRDSKVAIRILLFVEHCSILSPTRQWERSGRSSETCGILSTMGRFWPMVEGFR